MSKLIIASLCLYGITICVGQRCGIAGNSSRIVGGAVSPAGQWPWMALLQATFRQENGDNSYLCGGTIISDQWILTAAHCLKKTLNDRLLSVRVSLGVQNRNQLNQTNVITVLASQAVVHEDYNSDTNINDIGLLRLSQPLDLSGNNPRIGAVCLPINRQRSGDNQCYATGWGRTAENGTTSDQLRQVRLPVLNNTYCRDTIGDLFYPQRELCAGYRQGGRDTCGGDSGGPLVCPFGTANRWVQVGVTSWGYGCARPNLPGVFTRVAFYANWIQINTGVTFP